MSLSKDLFESASSEEQALRLKDPERSLSTLSSYLEEFARKDGKSFLTDKEKEITRFLLKRLIDSSKECPEFKENWGLVHAVFLATIISWSSKMKEVEKPNEG